MNQRWQERLGTGWRRLVVVAACVVVVWTYAWIARPAISQLLGNDQARTAYYNLLVDGFRAGQLAMKIDPDPGLVRLENPYDPLQNGPYRLHDATYYKGRYYLYFGVTPALVLFWPYVALTGDYLWHREAVAIFSSGVFLIGVGLLCAVRRRYFPRAGALSLGLAIVGLGAATTLPILLRRPDVWEVPISCAALFIMVTLALLWRAVHAGGRRVWWVAGASLAYGLAIGARPPILLGAVILLMPAAMSRWRERADWREVGRLVAAAVGPITLIGLGLLFYNWQRFDDPLEFGQKYQLAGVDNTQVKFFSPGFFWYHLRLYLWEPAHWSQYFPFVTGIRIPPPPPGQLGVESMFGVFTNVPLVWLALVVPFAARGALRWWALAGGVYAVVCGLTVCLFGGACNRYFIDFLPPWVLLAAVGVVAVEHGLAGRFWRWPVRLGWGAALVYSAAFVFFSSCEHLNLLRVRDAEGYARLARRLNTPIGWWESFQGVRHGPLELTLRLPPFTTRRVESVLVTGTPPGADYIWVEYVDPGHLRFGLEHTYHGGPQSDVLAVDYDREQVITIQLRSFYPPTDHPYWDSAEGRVIAETRDQFTLSLNDRRVLSGTVPAYDASPQTRFVGVNHFVKEMGSNFSGQVLARRTLGLLDPEQVRDPGPAAIKFWLPRERLPGTAEPLVQTGETGKADTLWIKYVDEKRVVLGLDHWGYGGPQTEPLEMDEAVAQRLEVRMGSLYPAGTVAADDPRRRRLEVKLNGRVVLAGEQEFHPSTAVQVQFGRNGVGASTARERFTGRMTDVWRLGLVP